MVQEQAYSTNGNGCATSTERTNSSAEQRSDPFSSFRTEPRHERQRNRSSGLPPKMKPNLRHLKEFCVHPRPCVQAQTAMSTISEPSLVQGQAGDPSSPSADEKSILIKEMCIKDFVQDGLHLYFRHFTHPDQIPGQDMVSRAFAMTLLPVLIIIMTVAQWVVGLIVKAVNCSERGSLLYKWFVNDQMVLLDESDHVDPDGIDEAVKELADQTVRDQPVFNYYIANLLLIMSSLVYQRDEKMVAKACETMCNIMNADQREKTSKLLDDSAIDINEKAEKELGMHFSGISELKTRGGPFAGLFYNDNTIVLVFKGTSVLSFNEYLLDATVQRVDAREFLYGEVHKGFYESLFPDPTPLDDHERRNFDATNPFSTIMGVIFDTARDAKARTGKPLTLWITGHSLGGALAGLTFARLQMPMREDDPLLKEEDEAGDVSSGPKPKRRLVPTKDHYGNPLTVLQAMLARYSDDKDLIILRDAYSLASPRLGDTSFARQFAWNHRRFMESSLYKSTYWRVVVDKDIIPIMPFGIGLNPTERNGSPFPCPHCPETQPNYDPTFPIELQPATHPSTRPRHLHSLLDYQHVGQVVRIHNMVDKGPHVGPTSCFDANLAKHVIRSEDTVNTLKTRLETISTHWKKYVAERGLDSKEIARRAKESTRGNTAPSASSELDSGSRPPVSAPARGTRAFSNGPAAAVATTTAQTVQNARSMSVLVETVHTDRQGHVDGVERVSSHTQQVRIENRLHQSWIDSDKATNLVDVDALSRMRPPTAVENIMLLFPGLLSHSPVTYQRNLVRSRFEFQSFPGPALVRRLDALFDEVTRDGHVRMGGRVAISTSEDAAAAAVLQATTTTTTTTAVVGLQGETEVMMSPMETTQTNGFSSGSTSITTTTMSDGSTTTSSQRSTSTAIATERTVTNFKQRVVKTTAQSSRKSTETTKSLSLDSIEGHQKEW